MILRRAILLVVAAFTFNVTPAFAQKKGSGPSATADTFQIRQQLKNGSYYLLKADYESKYLDSAYNYLEQALHNSELLKIDKWINESYTMMGSYYCLENKTDSGKAFFNKAITYYQRKGDLRGEAETWSWMGRSIPPASPALGTEKAGYWEHAYELYTSLNDTLHAMLALKGAGDAHLYDRNFVLSENQLLAVINGFKAIHYRELHFTYDLLRVVARHTGNPAKEIFYTIAMLHSLDSCTYKTADDSVVAGRLYGNAALSYAWVGIWDKAVEYARKGWTTVQFTDWNSEYFYTARFFSSYLVMVDSPKAALNFLSVATANRPPRSPVHRAVIFMARGECYQALGDDDKAEKEFSIVLPFINTKEFYSMTVDGQQRMILTLGEYFLKTRQYAKADYFSGQLQSNKSSTWSLDQRARVERFQASMDSVMGRYHSALKHFAAFQLINDTLRSVQKAVQVQELELKYLVDKKENDLNLQAANIKLLTQKNQLQEAQVSRSKTLRKLMGIGLLFLMLLVAMIYYRYRFKQQRNRELEQQQKEIKLKNQELQRLLGENEWLLQEVHHRVKNNLQVVTSLLTNQMEAVGKGPVKDAIMESRQRIEAMAMIHQRLYNNKNCSSIQMPAYVSELVEHLRDAYKPGPRIVFRIFIEQISLDIAFAVPVALILNEAISNALKHAFPREREGSITVRLHHLEDENMLLEVMDDGTGIPQGAICNTKSFGIRLIKGLASDINGDAHIENREGTVVSVHFFTDIYAGKSAMADSN